MVKNSGKGGKKHKRSAAKNHSAGARELLFREDGQEYAIIKDILGNCRFRCDCQDGKSRLGSIRGKLHKKVWMTRGDVVLVGLREFQDEKCDIIHKYTSDEASQLRKYEEITFHHEIEEESEDTGFKFGDSSDEEPTHFSPSKISETKEKDIDIDNI